MIKKIQLIILLSILGSQYIWACSAAYQYSLFPLGGSAGQVLLLEMELERYLKSPEGQMMEFGPRTRFSQKDIDSRGIEVRWKGSLKLYTASDSKMTLYKDLGAIDILDEKYDKSLQPYFSEAMEIARKMPFFEEAILENMGICHYDRTCTFFKKIINKENLKFYCKSSEQGYTRDSCEVVYPYKILQKAENQLAIKVTQMDSVDKDSQIGFFRIWSPQNIRRYTIGTTTVQIYTLGRGDKSKYAKTKREDWEKINIEGVEFFILGSDVIYHGQRFDFLHFL